MLPSYEPVNHTRDETPDIPDTDDAPVMDDEDTDDDSD